MIISFGDKETKKIWEGEIVKGIAIEIQETTRRKPSMLHNSQDLQDLMIPPSNRLEKLKGNLKDFYSIRIKINGEYYLNVIMVMQSKLK